MLGTEGAILITGEHPQLEQAKDHGPGLSAPEVGRDVGEESVCLVLLIIFMVVTPMLQKGKPVLLPQTDRPDKHPESKNELLVSVEVDKNIFIDTKWFPDKDFAAKMKELGERNAAKEVIMIGRRRV